MVALFNTEKIEITSDLFSNIDIFEKEVIKLPIDAHSMMNADLACMPDSLITNLAGVPKILR